MTRRITVAWLAKHDACPEGRAWWHKQGETDAVTLIERLAAEDRLDWANWTLTQLFTRRQNVRYAVFAGEQVLGLFEAKHPEDGRPRQAIEAALAYLEHPSKKTRSAAESAARSAAESARSAAGLAAWSAAESAWSAAESARSAAESAWSAAGLAAWSAAESARSAAELAVSLAAGSATMRKIVGYGLELLEEANRE